MTTQQYQLVTGVVEQKIRVFANEMRKQEERKQEKEKCRNMYVDNKLAGLSRVNDELMAEVDELKNQLSYGMNKGGGKGKGAGEVERALQREREFVRGCNSVIKALHRGNPNPESDGYHLYSFYKGDVYCHSRQCLRKQYPNNEERQWIRGYNHLVSPTHCEQNQCATINVDVAWG